MTTINVPELIKAGVHFGHRTSRWNPKMAPYIFKKRNLIHIIDLKHTVRGLLWARRVAAAIAAQGHYVLFAGTKRQARPVVLREAQRCAMPCVTERWPGGLLTNYATIRRRLQRLEELEEMERSGAIELYSKKMLSSLRRERRKIERNLGGVRNMDRLPGLLVVVDPKREQIAVREAVKLRIPTIAWIDTDGDPQGVNIVVPANDDAIGSIEIFVRMLADAVLEGRQQAMVGQPEAAKAAGAKEQISPEPQPLAEPSGPRERLEAEAGERPETAGTTPPATPEPEEDSSDM